MTEFSYKELVQRLNEADKMSDLRVKRSLELREALKETGDKWKYINAASSSTAGFVAEAKE